MIKILMCLLMILQSFFSCFICCELPKNRDDIIILFTNDIHGSIEDGVTLSGVAEYKEQMKKQSDYVALVDCGDAVSGSSLSAVSRGELIVDVMNAVGYDLAILGNHEFDFGLDRLAYLLDKAQTQYIDCNVAYSGTGVNPVEKVKPYEIIKFGDTKVGFIGITTPYTVKSTSPRSFMQDDETVITFGSGETADVFYDLVQGYVDEVKTKGADYVVAMAHMGISEEDIPYRSSDLIANTTGIDVVLDGHSHSTFTNFCAENKDGKNVIWAQTGTMLANLGELVITADGLITVSNVSDITEKNEKVSAAVSEYVDKYSELLNQTVATSDFKLSINDENGVRAVRNRETAIGNLCSDATRYITGADVSFNNGGGIRADLPKGTITYADIIAVHPFGNMVCMTEVTGSELLDMLEYFCKEAKPEVVQNGAPVGESGSFPNMSGITFTIDTTVESSVVVDADDCLVSVGDTRRVSNVNILNGDVYEPIDVNKTYTLAVSNYVLINGGSGMVHQLAGHKVLLNSIMTEYESLATYITEGLKGDLSAYAEPAGRITFIR